MISLRKATLEDIPLLEYWDTKQHVIDCDPEGPWDWNEELKHDPAWREQFVALKGEEPIGFIQIIDPAEEESHYWGNVEPNQRAIDIWIGEESDLNRGYGTEMMHLAIKRCFEFPEVKRILIDPLKSNAAAHRFYKRLGFRFLEERTFDTDLCLVFEYTRGDYLKSLNAL